MTHEAELLAQIEDLDSAINRDMDALSRAKSQHASADLWASIRLKMGERRELRDRLPGPPPQDYNFQTETAPRQDRFILSRTAPHALLVPSTHV